METTLTEENLIAIEIAMSKIALIDQSDYFRNYQEEVKQRLVQVRDLERHKK